MTHSPHTPTLKRNAQQGFTLILVLSLVALLTLVLGTYAVLTMNNVQTNSNSRDSSRGLYAAEAALNSRAERIRQRFVGFRTPAGPSPLDNASNVPCQGSNQGSNDMQCESLNLEGRNVTSYAVQGTSQNIQIPPGEDFAGLSAEETPFTVNGVALNSRNNPEAIASLVFKSRLVPLFQFAVFFSKDLEFDNTAQLTLSGPVHTNGNLFLDGLLTINGSNSQVTSAQTIYRGVKQNSTACVGTVQIGDATNTPQTVNCNGTGRKQLTTTDTLPFGNKLKGGLNALTVPTVADLQPVAGNTYWDKADVRIVLKQTGSDWNNDSNWTVNMTKADGSTSGMPSLVNYCNFSTGGGLTSSIITSSTFRTHTNFQDNREYPVWSNASTASDKARVEKRMLDIDVRRLLACIEANSGILNGLSDTSDGGLVVYLTVDDRNYSNIARSGSTVKLNNYGFRLVNGKDLSSALTNIRPKGLTFVSDQAVYIQGDFNSPGVTSASVSPPTFATLSSGWIPSSIVADSVNVLSSAWNSTSTCRDANGYYRSRTLSSAALKYSGTTTVASEYIMGSNGSTSAGRWYYYNSTGLNSSNNIPETATGDEKSTKPLFCRTPDVTTIQTAILAGTATTGNQEGAVWPIPGGATSTSITSGGVHNMMRFHEDWQGAERYGSSVYYNYSGSLVSLSTPLHVNGAFKLGSQDTPGVTPAQDLSPVYRPPTRQWQYDQQFNQAANLPPLTPRFVYIKQENFTRRFTQE